MEIQKFVVTSNKNNYLHGYHTTYGVGDDDQREIAKRAIESCKPPPRLEIRRSA